MNIGFYAGSFDPFTNGHLHVVKESIKLFDKVIIGIAVNPDKNRRFDKSEMKKVIDKIISHQNLGNVECVVYDELTADIAIKYGATYLIRGIRNTIDFISEEDYAKANKELSGLETLYIRAGDYEVVSSTLVYELYKRGKDISQYVPKEVLEIIK